jgi:hypothetical protein
MDTALDYLLEVYKLPNDKNKFHSAEIITEHTVETGENPIRLKPQLKLKFIK